MIYVAIDPGGTTGWAAWQSETDAFASGEVSGRFEMREQFDAFVSTTEPDALTFIIEDFIISTRTVTTKLDYSALRLIGYIELRCEHLGYDLTFQRAAQIKSKTTVGTDANLKKIGWYRTGLAGHANDAARHLLVHVRNLADAQHLMKRIAA